MNSNVELIENFDVLWTKEDRLALALSGGVDSIVLFHLLVTKYGHTYKELVVFHINHGLRKESYEEAEFVEKFVNNYDIRFYKKELEMNSLARDKHISEEMLARELRYKAFNEMAAKENITKILTAHHKNDQVENILMRLLTGRSMDYNLAIDNKGRHGNLTIYRPLLNVLKETLEQYAQENNLKYYTDESNFDTDYTRNNIRHNIIPLLNDVSTASFDNLINFAQYYKNINDELKTRLLANKDNYILEKNQEKVVLLRAEVLSLSAEEIYFLLKDILMADLGVFDVTQRALFKVVEQLRNNLGNKSYDLKNNLKIVSEYSVIYVHKIEKKCYNDKMELIIDDVCKDKIYKFCQSEFLITTNNEEAEIGFNKEDLPLLITTKRQGDRLRRGNISKKLSRFFIDEKIPKDIRNQIPVVRSGEKVLGIIGLDTKINKDKRYDYYIKTKG